MSILNFMIGWPYAAKAVIQHEFDTDHLNIYVTFAYPMNQTVMPDLTKWNLYADDILEAVSSAVWQDSYTLLLTVPDIASLPSKVKLKYQGPGPDTWPRLDPLRETLETTFRKQWEKFGKILSLNITT